jgi:hypothetical protein
MGNLLSTENNKHTRIPASVWGYGGTKSSTMGGLYFSAKKNKDGKYNVRLYHEINSGYRSTVFFNKLDFDPVGIEITMTDEILTVYFMKDQDTRCNPVIWRREEYELDGSQNIVSIKRRNDVVSAERRAIVVASSKEVFNSISDVLRTRELTSIANKIISADRFASGNAVLFHDNCSSLRQLRETISSMTVGVGDVSIIKNSAQASVIVQSDNSVKASCLQEVHPPLSVDFQADGSATLAPEVFEGGNGERAPASQADVQQLSVFPETQHTSGMVQSRIVSASSAVDLVWSESPEQLCSHQDFDTETKIAGVKMLNFFSDRKHEYTVLRDRITYSIGTDIFSVSFGISVDLIKKILVYEIEKSLFLIVIHTFDSQVYLSGYSGRSTSPIFVTTQITSHLSFGQPNLVESIEFDSSNSLRFQINMTNSKKFFGIDNQDGSIRQLGCQWKKKL